jgi:HNH endonuclease
MSYVSAALRQLVTRRARSRCEYCLLHEGDAFFTHEVDHIFAEKHGGTTIEHNLCLACADCNAFKGSDLTSLDPLTGLIEPLYHPRTDKWQEHFQLLETGVIEPQTATGRVTVKLLRMNRLDVIDERARLIRLGSYMDIDYIQKL